MNEHLSNSLSIKSVDSFIIVIKKNSQSNELLITTKQQSDTPQNKNQTLRESPQKKKNGPLTPKICPLDQQIHKNKEFHTLDAIKSMQKFESIKHQYIQLLNNSNVNPPTLTNKQSKQQGVSKIKKPGLKKWSSDKNQDKKSEKTIGKKDSIKPEFSNDYILGQNNLFRPVLTTIFTDSRCIHLIHLKKINKFPESELFLSIELDNRFLYCIQIYRKQMLGKNQLSMFQYRLKLSTKCDNLNIVKIYHIISDKKYFYFFYQACLQSDLASVVAQKGCFTEKQVRKILKQLFSTLEYLLKNGCPYFRITSNNIYFQFGVLKVSYLGQSISFIGRGQLQTNSSVIDKQIVWDIGILVYQMLLGKKLHLDGKNNYSQVSQVAKFCFSSELNLSISAKQFLQRCLTVNMEERPSLQQIKDSDFLKGADKYRWTTL